jgi:DNA replication protein DnaC
VKRQHEPQRIIGDLLAAELSEKQARSMRYQLTVAKLPFAKEVEEFAFADTPVNETLVRDLAGGAFLGQQRNLVLVGGTGSGKTHLAVGIARACIRGGARGRFYNVVDLVNRLDGEARAGRQGRLADHLSRLDFMILFKRGCGVPAPTADELGYLTFAQTGGQLLFHLISKLAGGVRGPRSPAWGAALGDRHHQPRLRRVALGLWRRQDDHGAARPAHPPLRHRRDRQRELALQDPRLT